MKGSCRLALRLAVLLLLQAAHSAEDMDLEAFDGRCKKLLWLTGLQLKTLTGAESQYIETSSTYQKYLHKALQSARLNAPSVQPVVVVEGEAPEGLAEWVGALGGKVVMHKLSFREHLIKLAVRPGWEFTTGLWGSYQRTDIPSIMEKVRKILDPAEVELEYVLWTDPDVLFLDNLDACTLPRPVILSNSPETMRGGGGNCGVLYFNVSAYTAVFPELIAWAVEKKWEFDVVDQTMLVHFFWTRISALPDVYNWKMYWGVPKQVGWGEAPSIKIIHFHGPKLRTALCAMRALRRSDLNPDDINIACNPPHHSSWYYEGLIQQACPMKAMHKGPIMCLLFNGFKADRGQLYLQIYRDWFNSTRRLLP